MQKLFETLRHKRRLAMAVTVGGTLLFTVASAVRAASPDSWEAALASVLMLVGIVGQFMGLLALMKKPRR